MECNFLGVAFVADDVPKSKAEQVAAKMDEIIEKYSDLAQKEFDQFLESQGLESVMGAVIPKHLAY